MRILAVIAAAAVLGIATVAPANTTDGPPDGTCGAIEQHRAGTEDQQVAVPDMGYYQERLMALSDRLRAGNLSQQDQMQIGEDLSRMAEAMEYQDMLGTSEHPDMGMPADQGGSDTE